MLNIILLFVGIANLAMLTEIYMMLIRIGREVNQAEQWKGIPVKRFF